MQVIPFAVIGAGHVPEGMPVIPGKTAPHNATGVATHLGRYSSEGEFRLESIDLTALTGTFSSSKPVVFVGANGERAAFHYGRTDFGAKKSGTFKVMPQADGKVVGQFVAEFTPVPAESTGRFRNVIGGSFIMVATTQPFVLSVNEQGYTPPFAYSWVGAGALVLRR